MKTDYLDRLIFFGESTTTHLRARGVLRDGKNTRQVWADDSGTRMLSAQGIATPILYPDTGEYLTLFEACARKQPEFLVLSFGLNGILRFIGDKALYQNNYHRLIQTVHNASPNTKIILQTVYPVRSSDGFSVDVETLNSHIQTLNTWLPEIADAHTNVALLDTASVLRNEHNQLDEKYDAGDGIHLNADAYRAILRYLSEHEWTPIEPRTDHS